MDIERGDRLTQEAIDQGYKLLGLETHEQRDRLRNIGQVNLPRASEGSKSTYVAITLSNNTAFSTSVDRGENNAKLEGTS